MLFTKTKKRFISAVLTMAMVVGIIMVIPVFANEDNTTTFVYDGYRIDYTIDRVDGDVQDITVTITNTGADVIEDWELVYDDFGGVVEDIQGAEIVLNEHGIILEEMLFENAHKPMTVEMLENFKMEYYSELVNVESINDNSTILPSESVTFSYILSDFTDIPEFIGFEEDKVIVKDDVEDEEDIVTPALSLGKGLSPTTIGGLVNSGGINTTTSIPQICGCCGKYIIEVIGNKASITNYIGTASNVVIPNSLRLGLIDYYFVNEIGYLAFANKTNITSVTIPDDIVLVGYGAFMECSNLNTVIIGKKARIEQVAFYNCSKLKTVTFRGNEGVRSDSFLYTTLNKVTTPFGLLQSYKTKLNSSLSSSVKLDSFCVNHTSARVCSCKYRLGDVLGNGRIEIFDANEILTYLVGINNVIGVNSNGTIKNHDAFNASLITSYSKTNNVIRLADAEEIQKYVAGQSGILKTLYG